MAFVFYCDTLQLFIGMLEPEVKEHSLDVIKNFSL